MMSVAKLKLILSEYRKLLKDNTGHALASSENGPVGMSVIDAIAQAIEDLDKRLTLLEQRK